MLKKINLKQIEMAVLIITFILLTIPRSIDVVAPTIYNCINVLKLISVCMVVVLFFKNKIKLSKFTALFIIYAIYLFIVTVFNNKSLFYVIKVCGLDVGLLLFCDVVFNSKNKEKFIKFFSNYFFVLLIVNFICILIGFMLGDKEGKIFNTYILGQDNRFILYIIPTVIAFYYQGQSSNKEMIKAYISYLIGLITLLVLWSVSAFCVLLCIGALYICIKLFKQIKLNLKYISLAILIICIAVVFFKVQNCFSFIIVDLLHKSLTLSRRTLIWDRSLEMLYNSKLNIIFGFGYFDTSALFLDLQQDLSHLHNILINTLFFGGIIGCILYALMLKNIIKEISNIIKMESGKIISIFFAGILILLLFDTFEAYQIYYFMLYLIIFVSKQLYKNSKKNKMSTSEITQDSKVGILLATYNGEKYLQEQIESIMKQTYKNWIIYVSDDHSTDKTMEVIKKYKEILEDKLIVLNNENKLSSAKLNFANLFENVQNMDYYMFCDQDDVWDKNKIMNLLINVKLEEKENKIPILAYCDSKIVDEKMFVINDSFVEYSNKHLPEKKLMKHVLLENYFPGCAILFNKELKEKTETIYKDCEMHDWWLTLTAALLGKIIFVNEPLHNYRQHGNNTIGVHKNNGIIIKITNRIKKLFDFNKTKETWSNYQKTVLNQAEQLIKQYSKDNEINNENIANIEKFIKIMNEKNKLKRLILLVCNGYIPVEKVRVLRLVL